MKQTAVEWLVNEMREYDWWYLPESMKEDIIDQAKAIERDQIIEARNNGFMASGEGWNGEYGIEDINLLTQEIKSEQYYDETFKSE
jgi:hypothetical protein